MATFDSWEVAVRPPEDYLMHFRTRGSKNGVRRYQTESGEWTELGLEERRKREGWGEGGDSRAERKAEKRVRRAEQQLQRNEARRAKKEAKEQRRFEKAEIKRKKSLKGLTDEEMKAKLERAKMEAEYRDLTKRKGLIESGTKLISKYLEYKDNKEQREIERNKQTVDMERAKAEMVKAREGSKRAKYEAKKAKQERKKVEADVEGGLKEERKANLLQKKMEYKNSTIRGGIAKRINMKLTAGVKDKYAAERKAEGEVKANQIKSDGARNLNNRKAAQKRQDKSPELVAQERRAKELERERAKNQKQYEKELKRHQRMYNAGSFKKY